MYEVLGNDYQDPLTLSLLLLLGMVGMAGACLAAYWLILFLVEVTLGVRKISLRNLFLVTLAVAVVLSLCSAIWAR